MSVALEAQNKPKISFFLCTNFLLFCRQNQKNVYRGFARNPPPGLCSGPTWGLISVSSSQLKIWLQENYYQKCSLCNNILSTTFLWMRK